MRNEGGIDQGRSSGKDEKWTVFWTYFKSGNTKISWPIRCDLWREKRNGLHQDFWFEYLKDIVPFNSNAGPGVGSRSVG